MRSAVTAAGSPSQADKVKEEHDVARSLGLPVEWADQHPAFPTWGTTRLAGQLQLDPVRLVDALVAAVRRAGGLVVEDARVTSLSSGKEQTLTLTVGRTVIASTVTAASAAPVVGAPLAFTRLRPERSYLLAFSHPDPPQDMVLAVGGGSRSVRAAEDAEGRPVLLVGGEGHHVGRSGDEGARVEALRQWTAAHFPSARELAAWSAQDHSATTNLPLVGRSEGSEHVRIATGFHKWGLTNGPAAALAIADDVLGRTPLPPARPQVPRG